MLLLLLNHAPGRVCMCHFEPLLQKAAEAGETCRVSTSILSFWVMGGHYPHVVPFVTRAGDPAAPHRLHTSLTQLLGGEVSVLLLC